MKKFILFGFVAAVIFSSCKPQIILVQGDPSFLKGQTEMEIRFTYDDMLVGKEPESEYVKRRIKDDGEEWHEKWLSDRAERFEPRFIEVTNRYTEEPGPRIDRDKADSKYILIVNTFYTEPGFFIGIRSKEAEIGVRAIIVDRASPDKILAEYKIPKAVGAIATPDVGTRIQTAYGQAGRFLGSRLRGFLD